MVETGDHSITRLLGRLQAGDPDALDRLVPLVYDELRRVARHQLRRESPANTLSATTLVHEVYLRFVKQRQIDAGDRDAFLGIAARTMRRILVDHARHRTRLKRGGVRQNTFAACQTAIPPARKREAERLLAKLRANQQ